MFKCPATREPCLGEDCAWWFESPPEAKGLLRDFRGCGVRLPLVAAWLEVDRGGPSTKGLCISLINARIKRS